MDPGEGRNSDPQFNEGFPYVGSPELRRAGVQCRARGGEDTHIDEVLPIADQQVPEDSRLVQVPQADHVLHSMDGGGVHGFDVAGILRGNPVLLGREQGQRKISQMRYHWDESQKQPNPDRRTRWKNIHGRPLAHRPQLLFLGHGSD